MQGFGHMLAEDLLLCKEEDDLPENARLFQGCVSKDGHFPAVHLLAVKSLEVRTEAQNNMKNPVIFNHKTLQRFSIRNVQISITFLREGCCFAQEQIFKWFGNQNWPILLPKQIAPWSHCFKYDVRRSTVLVLSRLVAWTEIFILS